MSLGDNYDQDKRTVLVDGKMITLQDAFLKVKKNELSSEDLPKFPVPGKGYVHADKAYEIICRREGTSPA